MAQTRVASAAVDTALLARDTARRVVVIENSDANLLHIRIGGSAAATDNYSVSIAQNAKYEIPRELAGEEIRGIWATDGAGYAMITYGPGVQN